MKVLIACEESQEVCKAFRQLGHEAYSCDILPCSGGHPEWHIQGDVLPILEQDWDMVIAFPPCTHLAVSGASWFEQKIKDGRQQEGIDFFMKFANCKCPRIAIENPVGIMSTKWRKPNQIIQPYQFGEPFSKKTCLWLKGLPNLKPTNLVDKGEQVKFASGKSIPKWYSDAFKFPPKERSIARSKTFPGIAQAMAEQWGTVGNDECGKKTRGAAMSDWREFQVKGVPDRLGILEAKLRHVEEELLRQRDELNELRRKVNCIIESGGVNVY